MLRFLQSLIEALRPVRFARYRPAPRLGTRRLEYRLLGRIANDLTTAEPIGA